MPTSILDLRVNAVKAFFWNWKAYEAMKTARDKIDTRDAGVLLYFGALGDLPETLEYKQPEMRAVSRWLDRQYAAPDASQGGLFGQFLGAYCRPMWLQTQQNAPGFSADQVIEAYRQVLIGFQNAAREWDAGRCIPEPTATFLKQLEIRCNFWQIL